MIPITPEPLLDLLDGFRRTQVLIASVRLRLFDVLAAHDGADAVIGAALDLADRPNQRLLAGCAALGLTELGAEGRFRNSALADAYLVSDGERFLGDLIGLVEQQKYAGWAELSTALVSNRPTVWDKAERDTKFDGAGTDQITVFWRPCAPFPRPPRTSSPPRSTSRRCAAIESPQVRN